MFSLFNIILIFIGSDIKQSASFSKHSGNLRGFEKGVNPPNCIILES